MSIANCHEFRSSIVEAPVAFFENGTDIVSICLITLGFSKKYEGNRVTDSLSKSFSFFDELCTEIELAMMHWDYKRVKGVIKRHYRFVLHKNTKASSYKELKATKIAAKRWRSIIQIL